MHSPPGACYAAARPEQACQFLRLVGSLAEESVSNAAATAVMSRRLLPFSFCRH